MGSRKRAVISSHQTAKLVKAHKFANGFAAFACLDDLKNEPPDPHKPKNEEVEGGYSFFEVRKDGTNGKTRDQNSFDSLEQKTAKGAGFNSEDDKLTNFNILMQGWGSNPQ